MTEFYPALQKIFNPARACLYWFLFALISSALINSFFIDKHFSCDGVYYFWEMLEKKDFVHHDWARQYSLYLTQWPVVLAIHTGIKDIQVLNRLFALGIFSVYLLSFLLCLYSLRGSDKSMLTWPLLSMVAFNLSTDYHLTGEFPVVMLMSWPILFLLFRNSQLWLDRIFLFILLMVFTRIYQSAMTISSVFIMLLLYQKYVIKRERPTSDFLILIFLCVITISIAVYTTLNPIDESNKSFFIQGLRVMFTNTPAMVSVSFISLFFFSLIFQKKWLYLISLLPVLFYLFFIVMTHRGTNNYVSFAARAMSASLFPLLLVLSTVFYYKGLHVHRINVFNLVFFVIVITTGNIKFSEDWREYREEFKTTLLQNTWFVPIEKTNLMNGTGYWSFTNPYLSLVWSEGCVRSIVLNDSGHRTFPIDPYKGLLLKDYIKYNSCFFTIDSTAIPCK